jgi:2-dehydrotetronate isomerase
MPRFAANLTMMFTDVPFPARFERAARAGFSAVEFLFPYDHAPEEVAGWLKDHRLQNVLFNLPPGDWGAGERGLTAVPGREAEFRESVATALRYADALGTPTLHAMAGLVPSGVEWDACRRTYVENLKFAAAAIGATGRTLVIEAINPRDMPGFFLTSQKQAHALREAIASPHVKVQMDFYHAQIVDGDLAMCFRTHAAHIGHVQIASVPARHEPDEGEVNYPFLFDLLDELGYAGWVGCEYRPRALTEAGLGWLEARR